LGCGLITAVGLPAWFAVMALALGRETIGLAVVVAVVLLSISAVIGISAFRRLRMLPTTVVLDVDGWLRVTGRRVALALPAEAITEIEVGASPGLESVHLHTRQGRTVRLPGDLDDLDGFLQALQEANPAVLLTDHRRTSGGDIEEGPEDHGEDPVGDDTRRGDDGGAGGDDGGAGGDDGGAGGDRGGAGGDGGGAGPDDRNHGGDGRDGAER
jgi:uncharacterized membrane protein YgcG